MPDAGQLLFAASFGLVGLGIVGIVLANHLVRIVLAIVLLETGANLLLMLSGFRAGAVAPIIVDGIVPASMVDPVPQALVLTSIVIGVAVQAFMMALVLRVYSAYRTLDIRELRTRLEQDLARDYGVELPASIDAPQPVLRTGAQEGGP
jgi:multicomponent Na+:H+ antiporter subunit C